MKTELRPAHHSITGVTILEVWHDGKLIGTIAGIEGPGVRIISMGPMHVVHVEGTPNVVEVRVREG